MIKFEEIEVWGLVHAVRGMRNPMNSWDKSDSEYDEETCEFEIGENDYNLMQRLIKAGQSHRKFLRQIFISVDITAPLYWWKEFDTYKVGITSNSTSTMHKVHAKEFELDDFSCEHLDKVSKEVLTKIIDELNCNRTLFNKTKDKQNWWNIIQLLPSSYNQKRTITMSYENIINILENRRYHKLDEWRDFCEWSLTLPCSKILEIKG